MTDSVTQQLEHERDRLRIALRESVALQSHYARLLNGYDGGDRLMFASPAGWIERLVEIGKIPGRPDSAPEKTAGGESREEFERDRGFVPRDASGAPK